MTGGLLLFILTLISSLVFGHGQTLLQWLMSIIKDQNALKLTFKRIVFNASMHQEIVWENSFLTIMANFRFKYKRANSRMF